MMGKMGRVRFGFGIFLEKTESEFEFRSSVTRFGLGLSWVFWVGSDWDWVTIVCVKGGRL